MGKRVALKEGFFARKRERPTADQRILAPADIAVRRALAHAVAVADVQVRPVFPPAFQRHQKPRLDGQVVRLVAPRLAPGLGCFQHGGHL